MEQRSPDELDTAFAAMTRAGADALIVIEDALLLSGQLGRVVADLAAKYRLPVMYSWREWVVGRLQVICGSATYRRARARAPQEPTV